MIDLQGDGDGIVAKLSSLHTWWAANGTDLTQASSQAIWSQSGPNLVPIVERSATCLRVGFVRAGCNSCVQYAGGS